MCMVDRPFAKGDCVVWDKGAASFEGSCVSIVFLCCLRQVSWIVEGLVVACRVE